METLLVIILGITQGEEVGSRGGEGGGKSEDSCFGDIMGVNSYCVFFGGSVEGYPLV